MGRIERVYAGDGPKVVVLGDSITVSASDQLRAALDGRAVKIGALWGEGLNDGPFSRDAGTGGAREYAATYAADSPAVAVIALGTNDAWSPDMPLDAALDALDDIVVTLDPACIVTVTIPDDVPDPAYDPDEASQINGRLRQVGDVVVERSGLREGDVSDDGIHLTDDGRARWATLVAEGVETCLESG